MRRRHLDGSKLRRRQRQERALERLRAKLVAGPREMAVRGGEPVIFDRTEFVEEQIRALETKGVK